MKWRFFTELSRVLASQDIETALPTGDQLPILLNGHPVCQVQANGMLCIAPGDLTTPEACALRQKAAPISETVYEYIALMGKASRLESDSGNAGYRMLADFNGVILAGKETGAGYQFATWRHDAMGSGYTQEAYFADNYPAAKESFVRRSGLIPQNRLFNDAQLTEWYLCVQDTLDDNYELTDRQAVLLKRIAGQIHYVQSGRSLFILLNLAVHHLRMLGGGAALPTFETVKANSPHALEKAVLQQRIAVDSLAVCTFNQRSFFRVGDLRNDLLNRTDQRRVFAPLRVPIFNDSVNEYKIMKISP